jgi:hypothetical protein
MSPISLSQLEEPNNLTMDLYFYVKLPHLVSNYRVQLPTL